MNENQVKKYSGDVHYINLILRFMISHCVEISDFSFYWELCYLIVLRLVLRTCFLDFNIFKEAKTL